MNKKDAENLLRELERAGQVYISQDHLGICNRCGFREDLRMGACYDCASGHVSGKPLGNNLHELWDATNPSNRWVALG